MYKIINNAFRRHHQVAVPVYPWSDRGYCVVMVLQPMVGKPISWHSFADQNREEWDPHSIH